MQLVINNSAIISPMAEISKWNGFKYTEGWLKIKERCQEYFEAGVAFNHVVVSHRLEIGEEPPTDISQDV